MRFVAMTCLALFLVAAATMLAQSGPPPGAIQHIIIVIQENRSPDNLFATDTGLIAAGANLWSAATDPQYTVGCLQKTANKVIHVTPQAVPLASCVGPLHDHANAFIPIFDNGANDGLCNVKVVLAPGCNFQASTFPQYSYVPNTQQSNHNGLLDPYFRIAREFGFANYMFQTNQGSSFAAHQFLFAGTSAPDYYNDPVGMTCGAFPCWEWFVSENPKTSGGGSIGTTGCVSSIAGEYVTSTNPNNDLASKVYTPPLAGAYAGYPCYDHPSMQDELALGGKTWKYYSGTTNPNNAGIWNAPNALYRVCQPSGIGGTCTWPGWKSAMISPAKSTDDQAPLLNDIENDPTCTQLANVSWVVPDGRWSDHSNVASDDGGPSWAAAIVNAIGNENNCHYWTNTAILITWDDWGGWYDHISPAAVAGGPGIGYNGQTGDTSGRQYVYGFRVPLLVISAYTPAGYISGANTSGPTCPGPYCHDFGSILGYVEHVFNLPLGGIGPADYPYADYYAPDGPNNSCGPVNCPYPLADFFTLSKARAFKNITGAKYAEKCFHIPDQTGCFSGSRPRNPDDDGD